MSSWRAARNISRATAASSTRFYQPRLTDGIVRCYQVRDRLAGFGEQLINALYPAAPDAAPADAPHPGPRLYYPPTRPRLPEAEEPARG